MAFTRTNLATAVAGTLSLAMIAGCGPTPNANTPAGSASPTTPAATTSPAVSNAPVASPTPAASATPDPAGTGASPAPSASAPVASGKKVVVSGTIYSEEGAKLDGVLVKVVSLDANQPYNASTTSSQGSYVFNDVPEGVKVEVSVTRDGYTTRTQVESFQATNTNKNTLDFGGVASDAAGRAFFISKYPEIVSTTPAEDDTNVDPSTISVKVNLSEALDEDNKRRFEDALRILPGDKEAVGETGASTATASYIDLEDTNNNQNGNAAGATASTASFKYSIGKSVLFLEDSATRASITWSSDNKEATLTFNAPLLASSNDPAKYNIALVNASNDVIKDKDNNQLGTAQRATSLSTKYSTLNDLIYNAFKAKDLAVNTNTNAFTRWEDTHDNAATFEVKEDDDAPILQSVAWSTVGTDSRFELSFNEPMAAFNGTSKGFSHDAISSTTPDPLQFFTFAVAKSGKLKDVDLKGGSDVKAEVTTTGAIAVVTAGRTNVNLGAGKLGASGTGAEQEFRLHRDLFTLTSRTNAAEGQVTIEVDSKDAKKLLIYVKGKTVSQLVDTEMAEIKARVESLKDPAGNSINKANADRNVVTGRI